MATVPAERDALARVPRLALRAGEAAAALGVSADFYSREIAPELRIVRRGRVRLVATAELLRWLESNSEALGIGEA